MEQFTGKDVGALEDLKLSESQQCCASTETDSIFHCINRNVVCEAWSKPPTLQGNYKASAGIFYFVWALHFGKDVSQLDKTQNRVARMMGDVENMSCGQMLRCGWGRESRLQAHKMLLQRRLFAIPIMTRRHSNTLQLQQGQL